MEKETDTYTNRFLGEVVKPGYLYSPDLLVLYTATSSSSSDVTNPMLGSPLPIRAMASRYASSIEGSSLRLLYFRIVFTSILFGQKRSLTVFNTSTVRGFSFGVLYGYSIYFKVFSNRKRNIPTRIGWGFVFWANVTTSEQSAGPYSEMRIH